MFLADRDIQHALERVQTAFPSFTQWTYAMRVMMSAHSEAVRKPHHLVVKLSTALAISESRTRDAVKACSA